MTTADHRKVLSGVEKLEFGPPSDIYSQALAIALSHMGETVEYQEILCISGRAFKICWNDEMFFWDRFADEPDADPEYYLRNDYETAVGAVEAIGYESGITINGECAHPETNASTGRREGNQAVRGLVLGSIREGRPVVASLSVSGTRWAPEWSLITGYDDGGDTLIGWSCFQNEEREKEELEFEPEGCFRKRDWEKDALAVVRISGTKAQASEGESPGRKVLEYGIDLSRGSISGNESWGVETYERWACAVEDEENETVTEDVLKGRLQYHTRFIGHLAAQKWYASSYLRDMEKRVWSDSDVLHAAGNYVTIHELMWECWKVAGGYWRDPIPEVEKFRDVGARREITGIIREAGKLDQAAAGHMEAALAAWDKTHSFYMQS